MPDIIRRKKKKEAGGKRRKKKAREGKRQFVADKVKLPRSVTGRGSLAGCQLEHGTTGGTALRIRVTTICSST